MVVSYFVKKSFNHAGIAFLGYGSIQIGEWICTK